MYRMPSARKKKRPIDKLNLIPILDAVFIFVFFLLVSANFHKTYEITSDIPIISTTPPPKNQKIPLGLTLKITDESMILSKGLPLKVFHTIRKNSDGEYDLERLHTTLVDIKRDHPDESSIILHPDANISYEKLIEIMDSVRILRGTDEEIYRKKENGVSERITTLFNDIIFGNLKS